MHSCNTPFYFNSLDISNISNAVIKNVINALSLHFNVVLLLLHIMQLFYFNKNINNWDSSKTLFLLRFTMNTMNLMPVIVSSLNSQDIIESVFYFSYILVQKASLLFSFLDETGEVGLLVRPFSPNR